MPFTVDVKGRNTQFFTVFQPIFDLEENKLVAVEALSRVSSEENIESILRQVSLEGNSRKFTLGLLQEIASICKELPGSIEYLSVNIAMEHMCSRYLCDDLEGLRRELFKHDIRLMVELTESQPYPFQQSSEGKTLLRNIKELQQKGGLVAIDDYGKGFNVGEAIVSHLMPDVLKIDREVVQKPNEHKEVWSSVKSLLNGCKIKVVAEGIENVKDIDFVMNEGIRLCQGFYLGRPASL
ncbi:EAL domain-containing protein [Vibrio campbellii]|uniref:EAL domain-containing protein n=1 Tax=Vibrio campbellii (strain ATCC BAA-1116) TaxID=2902295 RepID=A7MRS5_VIBC1|nr:EAL domain-containing protein [Vibrio campbellii]ABU70606.1 hypothetical protein VIBHAR_01637 [Vibrio campbellii ATCC BAA-1116]AGU96361.1 hypothetical protein M892_04940 [Vibrio campbellii ATCC BAA-1116]MBT0122784.1 EAL domain-containing protein [Vibrio campbellii]MBT0137896.1 EAL domain-containing protein [Vibrio campbellii]MBT0142616.1 EAL domain-containing protein [Vibrio campbellii]